MTRARKHYAARHQPDKPPLATVVETPEQRLRRERLQTLARRRNVAEPQRARA